MKIFTNIDAFAKEIATIIAEETGLLTNVLKVRKNNDLLLTGVVIRESSSEIGPTFYVEDYYESYTSAQITLTECVTKILDTYENSKMKAPVLESEKLASFELVKDRIVARLVNREKNEELLKEVPHKNVMDLAVTYHIMVTKNDEGLGSARITNEIFECWGITLEELDDWAMKNTEKVLGYTRKSMYETLSELDQSFIGMSKEFDLPLEVITTNCKQYGAIAMLNTELLAKVCEEHQVNRLSIIPASVHEILALTDENINPLAMCDLVCEVNDTEVALEEILSYNVYSFDYETRTLDVIYSSAESAAA